MRYFSLFSGVGGFELGIQQAYENNLKCEHLSEKSESEKRPQGGIGATDKQDQSVCPPDWSAPLCIGFSEIDKYAIQIYEKHFNHRNFGDITKIKTEELPEFDLLVGGFPCQAFSIAGKRRGFEDTRGTLFFEIARILKDKQPRLFLLENVKGLLSHDEGRTFRTIITTLDELGYDLQWQVLNSKNFGVPQNRERVFIVGHLRGTSRPQVFPFGENSEPDIVLPTLTARYWGGQANGSYLRQISPSGGSQGERVYDPDGIATTVASQAGGLGAKTGLYAVDSRQIRDGARFYEDFVPTLSARDWKGGNNVMKDLKIRRLTPTECERLQGFPDGWTEGISDSQRYKCLGNAVTVNVIQAIMERLL